MSMYPDETVIVVDGVPQSYPGLKAGKFTDGNPADPADKPSYIPAGTLNLVLDNLEGLLVEVGISPSNNDPTLLAQFARRTVLGPSIFRNKFINGDFRFWQRGTVLAVTTGQTKYLADRFSLSLDGTGAAATYSQQAFALGQVQVKGEPKYYARVALTNGGDATNGLAVFRQYIESVRTLAGRKATLSMWAKADAPRSVTIEAVQTFGSGGAPSANVYTQVAKIQLTAAWQRFVVTFDVPSIAGKTLGTGGDATSALGINIWMSGGTVYNARTGNLATQTGTFDFGPMQIEEGPVATTFEDRPVGLELILAQRYYEKSFSLDATPSQGPDATSSFEPLNTVSCLTIVNSGGTIGDKSRLPFKVRKRIAPTPTIYGNSAGQIYVSVTSGSVGNLWASVGVSSASPDGIQAYAFPTLNGITAIEYFHFTADAEF